MAEILSFILVVVFFIVIVYKFFIAKVPPNFPPGPRIVIPVIGTSLVEVYKLFIGQDEIEKHKEYRKRYGNTYSLMLGGEHLIYLSDYDTIKEAFNKDSTNFRPNGSDDFRRAYAEFKGGDGANGIVDSHTTVWKEQRRFALQHLKNFGFGKSSMETQIMDEIHEFTTDLNSKITENNEVDFGVSFNISVMNILSRIVSGSRFDINNEEDQKKFHDINKLFELLGGAKVFIAFGMPYWLRKYNPYFNEAMKLIKSTYDMVETEKDKHLKSYDPDDMRDYMDCYLTEMKKVTEEGHTQSSFNGEAGEINLKASIHDMYLAGSETVSTTLLFSIIYMVNYPKVQDKIQNELDQVVGRSRLPSLNDRPEMPYLEATLSEIQRCANVAHQAVVHSNVFEPVEIGGYNIPTGCILISNLASVQLDSKHFENPQDFDPERFICPNTGAYRPHQFSIPFGIGKRECPGKSLAKMELYLFFATLLHQFTFFPSKTGPPKVNDVAYPLTRSPNAFTVNVNRRM